MDLLFEVAGWLGAGLLLLGYGLVTAGRLPAGGVAYQVVNLAGSLALMANSARNDAWPSAGLNLVWAVIGAVALVRLVRIGVSA
ncbi:CBU_0592 family membrane protein [Nonomuraea roseoviolacea]|uniref:CBU-0592-like domain-containing protein n=1 Tax=Nonomuraea roseoviolacea subsp. carminata TaxID=160689 RepID=A0ABT1JS70_9ACTN|nr:hypothetical protein [Nonomuraea roseoviolacea]MCP2344588.1 hypothetical protein [Nonomuraea roseoviolacea subsp. carminata]